MLCMGIDMTAEHCFLKRKAFLCDFKYVGLQLRKNKKKWGKWQKKKKKKEEAEESIICTTNKMNNLVYHLVLTSPD